MVFTWLNLAVVLFMFAGLAFAGGPLLGAVLFSPTFRGGDARMPYECGMTPHGPAWTRFGVNYAIYALLFLAFDVDVLYLFPVAAVYPSAQGWGAFLAVLVFLLVLTLAVVYFWMKGVFSWPRRINP